MPPRHLNSDVIRRIDSNENVYMRLRMGAYALALGDLNAVEFSQGGGWFATMARAPIPLFNRIWLSCAIDFAEIEPTLNLYQDRGLVPTVEVAPGGLSSEFGRALNDRGFVAVGHRTVFWERMAEMNADHESALTCRVVNSAADIEEFAEIYVRGWAIYEGIVAATKANIRQWQYLPGWRLYLGGQRGQQATGAAVLFSEGGFSYLADATTLESARGRGIQRALLAARLRDAKANGAEWIHARADFGSVSQRNLERAGLPLAYLRTTFAKLR